MSNIKHIPVRKCVVCEEKFEKSKMLRVAKCDGEILPDFKQKAGGRGAYICNNPDCHDKLFKKRRLDRAFKGSVDISVYNKILEEINRKQ